MPFGHRAPERYVSENSGGRVELGKEVDVLCCFARSQNGVDAVFRYIYCTNKYKTPRV